jgi:hypothetical protein
MSATPFLTTIWISHRRNKMMKIENDQGTVLEPYAKN